jgi:hypothetical protein
MDLKLKAPFHHQVLRYLDSIRMEGSNLLGLDQLHLMG